MYIRDAKNLADRLVEQMTPFCERLEIAGSIRRCRQDVKDIEIVAVPKWTVDTERMTLFDVAQVNLLYQWATANLRWIKPGTKELVDWQPKPDGRYWRALLDEGIKLDLFLTTPERWGLIFLIRTGSAEFSQGVMTYVKHETRYRIKDGALHDGEGQALETPSEHGVFDLLRLDYVEPHERSGFAAVTKGGRQVFPAGYRIERMAEA